MNAPTKTAPAPAADPDASPDPQGSGYRTLMVHLVAGRSNAGLLKITKAFADRFHAGVVGIAACQPMQLLYGGEYMTGDLIQQDRDTIASDMKSAETEFRNAFWNHQEKVDWRSCVTFAPLSDYIARELRCADLLLTSTTDVTAFSATRGVNAADLVMQAGRPVLMVPANVAKLGLKRAVVAWKDTREARRAVTDALPLLKASAKVTVVGLARTDALPDALSHLEDVVRWLAGHGVAAKPMAVPCAVDAADRLYDVVRDENADLIVAGAYGHSRLREWVLGGVTSDLLLCDNRCVFLSH